MKKSKDSAASRAVAHSKSRIILRIFEGGVDILRETTEISSGRIEMVSLGWADLRRAVIPEDVQAQMTAEELAATKVRLSTLRNHVEQRDRGDAYMLHADINRIRNWLMTASHLDVENIADDLIYEMQELRKLLMQRLSEG